MRPVHIRSNLTEPVQAEPAHAQPRCSTDAERCPDQTRLMVAARTRAAVLECDPQPMHIEQAIRTRRTHKAFGLEPVERKTLDELFELARWAPNHHATNPWRFRVVGRGALARLRDAAGREQATKLDRAPTLIVVSAALTGEPLQDEEDLHATAIAAYIVLLVAHARGFAGYWRTPAVLRTAEGRAAVGLVPQEQVVALIHLGSPCQEPSVPEREDPRAYITYLD
jgi:nitroreductase